MAAPQDLKVELSLDSVWTNITSYVYDRDRVNITRGYSSESASVEPSRCSFTVNNRDGRFSPRNPTSPYYGVIGRNTPVRVSMPYGEGYLIVTGAGTDGATTVDAAVLDVTGDIDLRIEVSLETWRHSQGLAGKYSTSGNNRSWSFSVDDDGTLDLTWSPDGTLAARIDISSTVPVPITSGRLAVRATLDVNNGAAGNTVTFYTSDTISGSWTILGAAVVTAGTTSIMNSNAEVEVGSVLQLSLDACFGKVHAFEMYNGIAGTLVANPNFKIQAPGTTSFNDTTSSPRTWLCFSDVDDRDYRFFGEVSSWPQRWDSTGSDVYVTIEAAGILRRLGQGQAPLQSTMYQGLTSITGSNTPVAYWPCEDGEDSTQIASAIPGAPAMKVSIEQPTYASYTGFKCSKPLPVSANSSWDGVVPSYTPGTTAQVRYLFNLTTGVVGERIFTVYTTGTLRRFALFYAGAGGQLELKCYDENDVQVATSGITAFDVDGKNLRMSLQLTQVGADVQFTIVTLEVGQSTGGFVDTTAAGRTFGRIIRVATNAGGGLSTAVTFGHISVHNAITSIFDLKNQLKAYVGETATDRMTRLCDESDISFSQIGIADDGEPMGEQGVKTLVELMTECANTDLGLLYEPRDGLGLRYRIRTALYNQSSTLSLVYADHELAAALAPVDDDQSTRNDVTVTRTDGSSARAVLETGNLSILAPPDGVGRYDTSVTISLEDDDRLLDHAGWRLLLGTVDEARYPQVSLNLRHSTFTGSAAKLSAAQTLDVGHRMVVSDLPSFLPPEDISQLILGYSEMLTGFERTLVLNCTPEAPYRTGVVSDTILGRADTAGSNVRTAINSSATTMVVNTTTGPVWTADPAEMPFDIMVGGEVMTVTAIAESDGKFELTGTGFTGTSCTIAQSTTRARTGGNSGLMTVTGTPAQAYFRPNTHAYVTVGNTYTVEFWAFSVAGYGSISAAIDWLDSSLGYLSTTATSYAAVAGAWTRMVTAGAAPANAAFADFGPTITGSPATGTQVWFDDMTLSPWDAQSFTVTRSVNGIVKSQTAGTDVRLLQPMIVSL
jgi:hypothetical protein